MPSTFPITNPTGLTDDELLRKVLQRAKKVTLSEDEAAVRAARAIDILDDRQKIFVTRFVETKNATQAAREAGYPHWEHQATRVLSRRNVQRAIAELLDAETVTAGLTPEGMLATCARVMRTGSPRDVLKALDTVLKIRLMVARGALVQSEDGKKRRGPIADRSRGVGPSPYAALEQTIAAHGDRLDAETRTSWLVQLQKDMEMMGRVIAQLRGGSTG